MKIKLTIAYDGALYKGWAKQPAVDTIQGVLEEVISDVVKSPVSLYGSGRTDTGVHAHAQVAHFEVPDGINIPLKAWTPAINSRLPSEIRIMHCEEVDEEFHARFSAVSKTYCYTIVTTPVLHPHDASRAWHVPRNVDLCRLQEALGGYLGYHDFRNFSALRGNETDETSYEREITQAELMIMEGKLCIRYSANGFLYKMVRILTGVAVNFAQGRISKAEFETMLNEPSKQIPFKYCAPAAGLALERVYYGKD